MEESAQRRIALLVVIPIAVVFNWLNKELSDCENKIEKKPKEKKRKIPAR